MRQTASAAADRNDDFQPVAFFERARRELAARHDFAISLDGDAFAAKPQPFYELFEAERRLELPGFSVDDDGDHKA